MRPWFCINLSLGLPKHQTLSQLHKVIPRRECLYSLTYSDALSLSNASAAANIPPRNFIGLDAEDQLLIKFHGDRSKNSITTFRKGKSLHLASHAGHVPYQTEKYADIIEQFQANYVIGPSEEFPLNADGSQSKRKQRVSTETQQQCSKLVSAMKPSAVENLVTFFFPVFQHDDTTLINGYLRSLETRIPQSQIGIALIGPGHGEVPSSRSSLYELASPERLNYVEVLGTPLDVLQCVYSGIHLFDLWYPQFAAEKGIALMFETEMPADFWDHKDPAQIQALAEGCLSAAKIDQYRDVKCVDVTDASTAREDQTTLSQICPYQIGYLHHLFVIKEMLGPTFLLQHNLKLYVDLFRALQKHKDHLAPYIAWFLSTQTAHINNVVNPTADLRESTPDPHSS